MSDRTFLITPRGLGRFTGTEIVSVAHAGAEGEGQERGQNEVF